MKYTFHINFQLNDDGVFLADMLWRNKDYINNIVDYN